MQHTQFSNVTKDYLMRYHEILEGMIQNMTHAVLSDSISHNFIIQMVYHHQGTIEMAQNLLRFTTNVPLQYFSNHLIEMKKKEIEEMNRSLELCKNYYSTEQDLYLYHYCFDQIAQRMFVQLQGLTPSNDVNINFVNEMIPLLKGAIQMSENGLGFILCAQLHPILQEIVVAQTYEVKRLECLHCHL